ncbi:helix-turn-helix domain-containing protein [Anaeromicropila herbilytica]|uniref:AraC family transcriptional regulator n=1 Tax=Anaeromicropila herbilytica TaxID=2785025 RepID=A0A7R7ID09_9FIRM|nr:AraC family transcriptional regulator [Anaeromicropila herbilytica]BCN31087.1 AraC family transcriptional regulator [Anaeromicropila herbilytica]
MSWNYGTYGFVNYDLIAEQSLSTIDLGVERRQQEHYFFENKNRNYEGYLFQYTLDGYGFYETPNMKYRLTKGKAFFITFPDDSKYYLSDENEGDDNPDHSWTYFYIHFNGPAVEPFFRRIRELCGPVCTLDFDCPPKHLFFELYELVRTQKQLDKYKGSEWLYSFLIALLRSIEFPPQTKRSHYVVDALEWMQLHYTSQISIEDMSREIGVSFSHLTRQFYKEQGLTPIQYLSRLRMEHAIYLLLNTDMSIDLIAGNSGYSNGNYFSKVFKKALRVTPMEYRKMHKTI